MGKLRRLAKDVFQAVNSSTPHQGAANAAQEKYIALMREAQDQHSGLSPEERAARRQEAEKVLEELRREHESAHRSMEALKARHPRWIS